MEESKVLEKWQARCSRMEYCARDVYQKALRDLEGDAEAAARVVDALKADRFIDDARYAGAFVREKSALGGWGPVKIRHMLAARGVAPEVISAALGEADPEASSRRMEAVIAAKYRLLREDPQCRLKLLRFALGRGYSYDEVAPAIESLLKGGAD